MIKYKQILEAINRGIQLALDNIEGQDDIQHQTHSKIKSKNYTKEYLDLMNSIVDLGLPSGTLWCKYNLGCNYDLLNNHSENSKYTDWYGDYYAWGELEPTTVDFTVKKCNPECTWNNYKYANCTSQSSNDILTKYCTNDKYGYLNHSDNLFELLPEDDVAYQNMHIGNYKFHMPTKEQWEELLKYTSQEWKSNYNNIIGLNGLLLTGKNNNTMFIPGAGNCTEFNLYSDGISFYAWSASIDIASPLSAWICSIARYDKDVKHLYTYNRWGGLTIRPIINIK